MGRMILLSFAMLGVGFLYLSYRYTLQDKKHTLEEEAGYVARLSAQVLDERSGLTDPDYRMYLNTIAEIAGSDLLVCDDSGLLLYTCKADGRQESPAAETYLTGREMDQVLAGERFAGTSDLGVYEKNQFVVAVPLR